MNKLYKIKFIKDTEKCKIGEIVSASKKSSDAYVNNGYAEYVKTTKKKFVKKPKEKKEPIYNKGSKRFINDMIEENKEEISTKAKQFIDKKRKEEPENPFTKELDRLEQQSDFKKTKILVLNCLLKKERRTASELIVDYIRKNEYVYTTRNDDNSEVWIYKEGIYVSQGKTFIRELCRGLLGEGYTTTICNEVISKIEADTYVDAEEFFSIKYINEIVVENGILNLKTKKLIKYSPKKIFFNKVPVVYDPKAECKAITKHFEVVLENKEDVPVMFELFGYLLYKEYKVEKAFMFCGDGRNGKGKTLMLMKNFIGPDNCTNIPIQQFENDLFSIGELLNKMANLAGDISKKSLKDTGHFKSLTGRDFISAARKFKTRVNFENYAKLIFCANELPITYDTTTAFFNRWLIINFPYTFVSQSEYDSRKEKENIRVADTEIINKITTKVELSGLLNKSLEGLNRLLKQGDFSYSKTTSEVREMWIRKSDSFSAFCMDCLEDNFEGKVTKKELRRSYNIYCKKYKLKTTTDKNIKNILETTFGVYEDRELVNCKQEYIWNGIKFSQGSEDSYGFSTLGKFTNFDIGKKKVARLTTLTNSEDKKFCEKCGVVSNHINSITNLCPGCESE